MNGHPFFHVTSILFDKSLQFPLVIVPYGTVLVNAIAIYPSRSQISATIMKTDFVGVSCTGYSYVHELIMFGPISLAPPIVCGILWSLVLKSYSAMIT